MRLFEFLKQLHDEIVEYSKRLIFDKNHARDSNLVSLYGSLIELAAGIVILIDKKAKTGVPPLFRTFLETYVEFRNLVEDPRYEYFMEASYYDQWLKVLREAGKGNNPYLYGIAKLPNLINEIRDTKRQLETLKKKNYSPLTVFKKFERAGMISEYRALYNFLSTDSHSNIRALLNRHIDLGNDNFEIIFYRDTPPEDFLNFINSTCEMLVDASIKIHEYLKSPVADSIRGFGEKLRKIQEQEIVP
jgi:hypothetical protein